MDIIKFILIIILMFVLRNLVHKRYHFIYFNGFTGIFMEFVIFFLLAAAIVLRGPSMIGSLFTPKEKDPGFYGTYHNLALLEGGDSDTFIILSGGDKTDGKMSIIGTAMGVGDLPWIQLDTEITVPNGKTFTCFDEASNITLTITADSKKHTLEVVQETSSDNTRFPFTGNYIDAETWEGMLDQVNAVKDAILSAQTPNRWMMDYFGNYVLRTYGQGGSSSYPPVISMYYDSSDPQYFMFDYYAEIDGIETGGRFEIPYPLGDAEPGTIACMSEDGPIVFEVLGNSESGNVEIVMTEFPDASFLGTYIPTSAFENNFDAQSNDPVIPEVNGSVDYTQSVSLPDTTSSDAGDDYSYMDTPEQTPEYLPEDEPWSWDGVYTCSSDGSDGTKTLTITQTSDSALSINMYHLYADGREESLDIVADIGTYNHGPHFASYSGDKPTFFTLSDDRSSIEVSQIGVYPAVDMEFIGIYMLEN